jgi:hypothetical protein
MPLDTMDVWKREEMMTVTDGGRRIEMRSGRPDGYDFAGG